MNTAGIDTAIGLLVCVGAIVAIGLLAFAYRTFGGGNSTTTAETPPQDHDSFGGVPATGERTGGADPDTLPHGGAAIYGGDDDEDEHA